MPVNFYLRSTPNKNGDCQIVVSCCIRGVRVMTSIGYGISPDKWDKDAAQVRKGYSNASKILGSVINARIKQIDSALTDLENSLEPADIPTKEEIKALILSGTGNKRDSGHTAAERLDEFIAERSAVMMWAESTVKKYNTMRNHIAEFNPDIRANQFTTERLLAYMLFLQRDKKMYDVSVKKEFKMLKAFLRWTKDKGYSRISDFETFHPVLKDTKKPVVFLTPDEFVILREYVIPRDGTVVKLKNAEGKEYEKTVMGRSTMEKCRDLLLFCCATGLRYSDMRKVKKTDVHGSFLTTVTQKTGALLTIPLIKVSRDILEKHKDILGDYALPVISEQKMNDHIKDLCELCGFNSPVTTTYYNEGRPIDVTSPKHDEVTTHCGRRTFVCLALLADIPPLTIIKITGHKTLEEMRPYIEITDRSKVKAMEKLEELMK